MSKVNLILQKQRSKFLVTFGFLLCSSLAILALGLNKIYGFTIFSPLILAITLGITIRNTIGIKPSFYPGIQFCLKRVLKLAIILLGLRLTLLES